MSKFSEYLKFLLDQNGESISSVSRKAGIERTSIHKALSDRRILAYKAVQKLSEYLQLTLDENAELFRLYNMLLQGENAYASRQEISELFQELSAVRFDSEPVLLQIDKPPQETNILHGQLAVCSAVREILFYEAQEPGTVEIDLYLPPRLNFVEDFISLWKSGRELRVCHLLCFSQNPGSEFACVEDLRLLRQVIPMCLFSMGRYTPYYYYDQPAAASVNPFCRYMITPRYLVLMTEDFSAAQIYTSQPLISHYRRHFQGLLSRCHVLSRYARDVLDIFRHNMQNVRQNGLAYLMAQPCPGRFYTNEQAEKYLRQDVPNRRELLDMFRVWITRLQEIRGSYITVFSEEGLWEFARTGVLLDVPSGFVEPLEQQDRFTLISQLREETAAEVICACVANPLYLPIPAYLAVYSDLDTGLRIYTNNRYAHGFGTCSIHIAEKGICHAFQDFFASLPDSQLSSSREETLQLFDRVLEYLKK